jgi:metallo-beta-lactamase family protein
MRMTFWGATETVTGSKFLIEARGTRLLVDCGLFQGLKQLRARNRAPLPIDPEDLDAVVLTHAHLDHSGYLPVLCKRGFTGPIYATPGTRALCGVLLPDAGFLQEEEARYANRKGYSKHRPALPLYTAEDGERCLAQFRELTVGAELEIGALRVSVTPAGHILGAACVRVSDGRRSVIITGDVGRPEAPVMRPPAPLPAADVLVLESTYGDRRHAPEDPMDALADIVTRVAGRGGVVVVPAFAVGRAQTVLHLLVSGMRRGLMPELPIYLNSPMAIRATDILLKAPDEHRLTPDDCRALAEQVRYVREAEESRALNARSGPMIIVSASGMATGGRVLHHLKAFAPDPKNAVLFTGFQAAGTRGQALVAGASEIKIHGEYVPVRAEIDNLDSLSSHADYAELVDWLRAGACVPETTYLVHGEPAAQDALRRHLSDFLGWRAVIPSYGESVTIDSP